MDSNDTVFQTITSLVCSAVPSDRGDFQILTCPSSSTLPTFIGRRADLRNALVTFIFFLFVMKLLFFGMTLTTYHTKDLSYIRTLFIKVHNFAIFAL